jgi:hypothetical protein
MTSAGKQAGSYIFICDEWDDGDIEVVSEATVPCSSAKSTRHLQATANEAAANPIISPDASKTPESTTQKNIVNSEQLKPRLKAHPPTDDEGWTTSDAEGLCDGWELYGWDPWLIATLLLGNCRF